MYSHCLCLNAYFYLTEGTWSFLYFITEFLRIFPSPSSKACFASLKTGPHASKEKVVHYFIPTFSSFWHLWGRLCPEVLPLKLDHQINYHSSLLSKYEWQWMTTGKANFQLWFVIGNVIFGCIFFNLSFIQEIFLRAW